MQIVPIDVVVPDPSVLPAAELRSAVRALQTQVTRDFAPVWNIGADLALAPSPGRARHGAWQLLVLDSAGGDIDGYHELTREGLPMGRVYLRTAKQCKSGWTTTASHELLELLLNPDTTRSVFVWDKSKGGRVYIQEVCDACQADRFAYVVDKVNVSDFVYPEWYETWRKRGSTQFDESKKLTRPFQVPRGCYATFYDARRRKWVDNYGSATDAPKTLIPAYGYGRGGSRAALRSRPRPEWRKSSR